MRVYWTWREFTIECIQFSALYCSQLYKYLYTLLCRVFLHPIDKIRVEARRSAILKPCNVIFENMRNSQKNFSTASKKVFFLGSSPLVVRCSWLQTSFGTASLSESSFLFFTSSQILLTSTTIGWLGLPSQASKGVKGHFQLCGLGVFLRDFLRINTPMMQCRCLTWKQAADLLRSPILFGFKRAPPSSFLRVFIPLATCAGSDFFFSSCTLFEFLYQEGLDIISHSGGSFCYLESSPERSMVVSAGSAATIFTLRWGSWHIRSKRHPCHNSRPFSPNTVKHGLTVRFKMVLARFHMVVYLCLGLEREDASNLSRVDLRLVPGALTHASPACSLTKWLYHP